MRKNIFKTPKKSNIEAIQRICGVQTQEKEKKRKRSQKKLLINKRLKQQGEQLNNVNREQECLYQKLSRIHDRYAILDNEQQLIKQDQEMIRKRQDKVKQEQQMIKQEQEAIAREIAELKAELLKQSKSTRCFQIQDNQQKIYQDSPKIKKNTDTKPEAAIKKRGFFPSRAKDNSKFIDKEASVDSNDEDITTPKLN